MVRFLFWRLIQSVVVLWAVYTVTFFLLMLTPGDPFISKEKKPPESVRLALAHKYHLEYLADPNQKNLSTGQKLFNISKAYYYYLGSALKGDFGPSIDYENWSVRDVISASLPVSISLGSLALVLALWGGVAAGTLGAIRKNGVSDFFLSVGTLLGVSLPSFVIGSLLIMVFVVAIPLMPVGGWGGGIAGLPRLILPAVTLASLFLAYIARLTRRARSMCCIPILCAPRGPRASGRRW